MDDLKIILQQILGETPLRLQPLSGGLRPVYRADLPGGKTVVAKTGSTLETEAYMLRYLREHTSLPVPVPLYSADELLVMDYIEGSAPLTTGAEQHAAELLAALHRVSSPRFGLEPDTLIGGLRQPNPPSPHWIPFFRDHRLLHMADEALKSGSLPVRLYDRVQTLAARLDNWLTEPEAPSLLHGDVWTGNVLARGERITGFIDPAIYYGHREIELAFITLFNTFGDVFFRRYHALYPIEDGLFEERRDLYNLYPLLVHVRLFGGGYVQAVERTLQRYGC